MGAETNEIAYLREQLAMQVSRFAIQHKELDESRKKLNKRAIELDEQEDQIEKSTRELNEKVQLLIYGNAVYGLTRCALLSRVWHENNPETSKHLFGFASWKDTVYKLHALFGVLPPRKMPNKKTHISMFE